MIRKASLQDISNIKRFLDLRDCSVCNFANYISNFEVNSCENCYVFIDKHKLKGIIAIDKNNYLYLCTTKQNDKVKCIEDKLLKYVLRQRKSLHINLNITNRKAINFFHCHDFKIIQELINTSSTIPQIIMSWALGCPKNRLMRLKGDS